MGKKLALIFIVYLLLAIMLLRPLSLHPATTVINAGDPLFYAWNLMHNWNSMIRGGKQLLDTNIYYPTTNTLAFSDTLFAQTILSAPILALTNNPIFAENLYILFTFPIAGIGMYLLFLWFTKHTLGAFLSGLFYAFAIPRLGQISHISIISSQWLPFLLLHTLSYLSTGNRRDGALALLWYILLTTSTIYFGVIGFIAMLIVVPIYAVIIWKNTFLHTGIKRIGTLLPFIIVSILILIAANLPYIRLRAEHPGIKRSLEESSARSAYQEDWYSILSTNTFTKNILPKNEGERALFPTFTLLLLAVTSCIVYAKNKRYRLLMGISLTIGITALVLSFGPDRPFHIGGFSTGYIKLPYAFLYKFFPLLQLIRVPARFSILVILSLSLLAPLILARIKNQTNQTALTGLISMIFLLEIWQTPLSVVSVPVYGNLPAVYAFIKNDPSVRTIIELPIGEIESGKTPIQTQITKSYDDVSIDDPLALEAYRVYFSGFHGKKTVNGYSGFIPDSFHEAVSAFRFFPSDEALNFLTNRNISHVIVHPSQFSSQIWEPNSSLTLVGQFGTDYLYKVTPLGVQ